MNEYSKGLQAIPKRVESFHNDQGVCILHNCTH